MIIHNPITRRTVLKSLSAFLALPALESFGASPAGSKMPKRVLFFSFAYGMMEDWFPKETGFDYTLPKPLSPLAKHKKDFSIISNLSNLNASDAHWSCTTFLTGANVRSTPGVGFKNSVSCDQVMAKELGKDTRFESLAINSHKNDGGWGPGLSLSWSDSGAPVQGINDPVYLYNKMFGGGKETIADKKAMLAQKRSMLDSFLIDAKSLKRKISKHDQQKMDSYFQSIRDIEKSLAKDLEWVNKPLPKTDLSRPDKGLSGVKEAKVLFDLMAAAFEADQTRVITYRLNISELMASVGYKCGSHRISHYKGRELETEAAKKRDVLLSDLLSGLYDRFKSVKEKDGSSLFDNSTIVFGTGIRTGHTTRDYPIIIGGHGGGTLKQGQHLCYESKKSRLSNLWLGLMQNVGVEQDTFSDSDGVNTDLFV